MKCCSRCKIAKPLEDFTRDRSQKDGHHHRCRECQKEFHSTYYTTERIKQISLKRRYGLTPEKYQRMVEEQQSKCKICGEVCEKLVVDHKHDESKRVRGLLCMPCNHAIGLFDEDIATMLAAVVYLRLDGAYDREQHTASYQIITTE